MKKLSIFLLLIFTLGFCNLNHASAGASEVTDVNIFSACTTEAQVECIESMSAIDSSGNSHKGVLTGRSAGYQLSTNDSFLKHLKGYPQEWNFPGMTFQNGSGKVLIFSAYLPKEFNHCWNNGQCQNNMEEFDTWIRPSNIDVGRPNTIVTGENAKLACSDGRNPCDLGSPHWLFGQDVRFEILARFPSGFKAAYTFGRAKNFGMQQISRNDLSTTYRIQISPLELENVNFVVPDISIFPQGLYVTDEPAVWVGGANNRNVSAFGNCWNPDAPSTGAGITVLTNATQMGMPYWAASEGMIKVYLSAPHQKTDGNINSGYLEVGVPLDQAKCMWGVNLSESVQATVQFIDLDGSTQTITSAATLVNGSYQLRVAGFHYSSPIVGVKFSQDTPVVAAVPTPSATPTVTPTTASVAPVKPVAKQITITCVKGKTSKKVTAVKPTCPKGYSKK